MRRIHWFEFNTRLVRNGEFLPVSVDATISSDDEGDVEIEGVKVFLKDTKTEIVVSHSEMQDIRAEIYETCSPDEPGADWRNEWD